VAPCKVAQCRQLLFEARDKDRGRARTPATGMHALHRLRMGSARRRCEVAIKAGYPAGLRASAGYDQKLGPPASTPHGVVMH
jgi:hypothetical protein